MEADQSVLTPAPQPAVHKPGQTPAMLVLQWLTYAFWGWVVLALSFLVGAVFASFIQGTDVSSVTPYGVAALVVLTPIAFVCDVFYVKREPAKKSGGSAVVMIIHAVLFAILGIGSLITAVFSMVEYLVNGSSGKAMLSVFLSALVIAIFYALTFLRTLNPEKLRRGPFIYRVAMIVSITVISIMSILGPIAKTRITRDDRLISNNLSMVSTAVGAYVSQNDRLPDSLQDLKLYADAKTLVDRNLVEYKATTLTKSEISKLTTTTSKTYYYQLCVTYKKESGNNTNYGGYAAEGDGYTSYPYTYNHPAGYTCYKLNATAY